MNENLNKDKLKIDKIEISESGIDVSNSIEEFSKQSKKTKKFIN